MATYKDKRELKATTTPMLADLPLGELEYAGMTTAGPVYYHPSLEVYVEITAVVKSDTYDLDAELTKYDERLAREADAARKKAEKEAEKAD